MTSQFSGLYLFPIFPMLASFTLKIMTLYLTSFILLLRRYMIYLNLCIFAQTFSYPYHIYLWIQPNMILITSNTILHSHKFLLTFKLLPLKFFFGDFSQ